MGLDGKCHVPIVGYLLLKDHLGHCSSGDLLGATATCTVSALAAPWFSTFVRFFRVGHVPLCSGTNARFSDSHLAAPWADKVLYFTACSCPSRSRFIPPFTTPRSTTYPSGRVGLDDSPRNRFVYGSSESLCPAPVHCRPWLLASILPPHQIPDRPTVEVQITLPLLHPQPATTSSASTTTTKLTSRWPNVPRPSPAFKVP